MKITPTKTHIVTTVLDVVDAPGGWEVVVISGTMHSRATSESEGSKHRKLAG
jgi:hypothetical protein